MWSAGVVLYELATGSLPFPGSLPSGRTVASQDVLPLEEKNGLRKNVFGQLCRYEVNYPISSQLSTKNNAVLCCAVLCCAVLCCAVLCCAVLCCAVLCCAVLCCAVLCCAVLCCAVLCCAVLCCAVLLCCAFMLLAQGERGTCRASLACPQQFVLRPVRSIPTRSTEGMAFPCCLMHNATSQMAATLFVGKGLFCLQQRCCRACVWHTTQSCSVLG